MKRVMCVWLPHWPLQRKRLAAARGLPPGGAGSLPDDDPFEDLAGLYRLAGWCERFCPLVGLEDTETPECLLLDITGCETATVDPRALSGRVARELWHGGFDARVAVADTVGAAWAAAHFVVPVPAADAAAIRRSLAPTVRVKPLEPGGKPFAPCDPAVMPPGRTKVALASLRVEALRLPIETVRLLEELGIRQIGQLDAVPRKELAARLGRLTVERLAQAWGETPEVIVPHRRVEIMQEEWHFEYPTDRYEIIEAVIGELTQRLVNRLRGLRGVQRLECRLCPENQKPLSATAEMYRPCADPARLAQMVRLRLEAACLPTKRKLRKVKTSSDAAPGSDSNAATQKSTANVENVGVGVGEIRRLVVDGLPPIAVIRLRALATELLQAKQEELFDDRTGRNDPSHALDLVERLTNRLGRAQVLQARLVPDAQPERAFACEPVVDIAFRNRTASPSPKRPKANRRWRPKGRLEIGGIDWTVADSDPRHGSWSGAQAEVERRERRQKLMARPLRLLPQPVALAVLAVVPNGPPVRFEWERVEQRIERYWGPERIETGWWRGPDIRRDYYRVETEAGLRFWLFRRLDDGKWFLHGTFE